LIFSNIGGASYVTVFSSNLIFFMLLYKTNFAASLIGIE